MMTADDARFLNLRVTDNPEAIERARHDAKAVEENGADDSRYIIPREPGPNSVTAADSKLIEDLIANELVPGSVYAEALRAISWPSGSSPPRNSYVLWTAFKVAGLTCSAPEDDGRCPYNHVEVIREHAEASQSTFKPEAAFQATKDVDTQEDYDDTEFPILLQFIVHDKLYRFRLQQLGFIPDGAAFDVVNRVLADVGEQHRFNQIDVHDLGGEVFALPSLLSEFCAKYEIHVYGFHEAPCRRVKTMPPIWDEWNDLMTKRAEKPSKKRR